MPQVFLLLLVCICTTVTGQLLFKKGMLKIGELHFSPAEALALIPQLFHNAWIMLGVCFFGFSFILWLFILSKLQLNIAYPIALSSEVILASTAAWFLFKEHLLPIQIFGIVVIITGIFLLLKS